MSYDEKIKNKIFVPLGINISKEIEKRISGKF